MENSKLNFQKDIATATITGLSIEAYRISVMA